MKRATEAGAESRIFVWESWFTPLMKLSVCMNFNIKLGGVVGGFLG